MASAAALGVHHRPDLPAANRTLGWQAVAWCEKYLVQPDGPEAGDPWKFTEEQIDFLWLHYAIDENGRFLHSRSVLRRSKGWGKSPFLAAVCLFELLGPCRFGGFDDDGFPVGIPVSMPWVQIAGVSEKQTQNTLTMVLAMARSDALTEAYPDLDPGLTRIYVTSNGGKLEPITASASTAEGARPTFAILDETHHWTDSNGGHKLAQVLRRNLGKIRGGDARSIETTNAHAIGEDSVAERSFEGFEAEQKIGRHSILYDSREAVKVDLADREAVKEALRYVYGDSTWVDLDRLMDEIYDPNTPPSEARRFYLNQLAAAEDAWIRPEQWDALANPELKLEDGDLITLGFDGSKSGDHTALMACRVADGALFALGVWNPEDHGGEIPGDLVDEMVCTARERFDVVAFYGDVHPFESYIDRWAILFAETQGRGKQSSLCLQACARHSIGWDMRTRTKDFTIAVERVRSEIEDGTFQHDGNKLVRTHAINARRRSNAWGVTIGKEHRMSERKIDSMPAGILARLARIEYLALPKTRQRRKRTGGASF
jgi:hypothetical protein